MLRYLLIVSLLSLTLYAKSLTLQEALKIVRSNNLELKVAKLQTDMKAIEAKIAKSYHYGKLDLEVMGMRSNDPGNVFGFKIQSREATFKDFGFEDFLQGFGAAMIDPGTGLPDFTSFAQAMGNPAVQQQLLSTQPGALNYPDARNHYVTKLRFVLPLYTGGKLSEYERIAKEMVRMSKLDMQKLTDAKVYQVKKTFFDITLVENYLINLSKIIKNIKRLKRIVKEMHIEGYVQTVDILEVDARLAEAEGMYNQAKLNRTLAYRFLSFLLNKEVGQIKKVSEFAPMPKVNTGALERYNIDIQKAMLGLKLSRMMQRIEEAKFKPTVGLFAEYGSADNKLFNEFSEKDFYSFGVKVSWNLFNGGADSYAFEKAKLNTMKVATQVELAKKGIALKANKLQSEIRSIEADIQSYKKQLRFAKKVYETYRAKYQEGLVSISDLLIKQSKELEMLLKLLTAKNKRNTKVFELEALLSKGEV